MRRLLTNWSMSGRLLDINAKQKTLLLSQDSRPFPILPILKSIEKKIQFNMPSPSLQGYVFITGQHGLSTTGSLFQWFRDTLKLSMASTYMVGKSYSNSQPVIETMQNSLKLYHQQSSKQLMIGGFAHNYDADIVRLWGRILGRLQKNRQNIKGIILMDDGGHLFMKMPSEILDFKNSQGERLPMIGIEQTSSGVGYSSIFPYPIIEVASAAAKQLEASLVAKVVKKQLDNDLLERGFSSEKLANLCYGIAGCGKIGTALVELLQSSGYKNIIVLERAAVNKVIPGVKVVTQLPEFIKESAVILGCTGEDFMKGEFDKCLQVISEGSDVPKIFASASSKDTEFNSLLIKIQRENRNGLIDPLKDILYSKEKPCAIILGGGMPLNFKMVNQGLSQDSVAPQDIQLTRGLLAAAVLQACDMMEGHSIAVPEQYQLDAEWQRFVVKAWCQATGRPMMPEFEDLTWIRENSVGKILKNSGESSLKKTM